MKSYDVFSRYGTKYRAVLIDDNTIHFYANGSSYVRAGAKEGNDIDKLGFFDPEGGPFIALFETPAFCIHNKLPNREIIEIIAAKDHYVIKLQEAKSSKKPVKRKTKINTQKILKSKKHIRN